MLALQIQFSAGRYHATPWGRHVNEGEVAWPPEPWRLLRALIATWHHKVKSRSQHDEATLNALITALAGTDPDYHLPPASHAHTRHYLPQAKAGDTSLVFDAFAAVDRTTPLYVLWPELELDAAQAALLDELLVGLGYLGRSESWVEACRVDASPPANCVPGDQSVDHETGELLGEVVRLQGVAPAADYAELRQAHTADRQRAKKLADTLPEGLVAALSVDTGALQKQGWSAPPAARLVNYLRPLDALRPQRRRRTLSPPCATSVSFLLIGNPLPLVEETLRVGELMRMAVMSRFGNDDAGQPLAPPLFSGHNLPPGNRHQHAFYLPWDRDGDGRLDRLLIHVPAGFQANERRVIESVRKLYQGGEGEWRLVLEATGSDDVAAPLAGPARVWESITPYLHPWHRKTAFGPEEQIRRECRLRGVAEPEYIEALEGIPVGHRRKRPIHFTRFRRRRGLAQPDRHGSLWRLSFTEPVFGPLALGFSSHFGLGLFAPVPEKEGL